MEKSKGPDKEGRLRCGAILLAGGSGTRMGTKIPKQLLPLCGRVVLTYSLEAFEKSEYVDEVVLVSSREIMEQCQALVRVGGYRKVKGIVPGGANRYDSVYAGLLALKEPEIIHIHDGARPFVTEEILKRCYEGAISYGACAAGVPSKDTVKVTDEQGRICSTPDRRNVWIVQTPQSFRREVIIKAHETLRQTSMEGVTDDAMMVERMGEPVYMVMGGYENIKLTSPEDLLIAQALMKGREEGLS